jgi:hypothetical protein
MSRDRGIIKEPSSGKSCGAVREDTACNGQACPVDCKVSSWGAFGACSAMCGFGKNTRTRQITDSGSNGGVVCPATDDTQTCMLKVCEHPCPVSEWGNWSPCPTACNTEGKTFRTRTNTHVGDTNNPKNDSDCPEMRQEKQCTVVACNSDCVATEWGSWGACSKTCGAGKKKRTRDIETAAQGTGKPCELEERTDCAYPCPVDCLVGAWGDFGACSTTCGAGTNTATRKVIRAAAYKGKACPALTLSANCKERECPIDCEVNTWYGWSDCTKSCSGGFQTRKRTIKVDADHNGRQCPALEEQRQCNWHPCPIDCIQGDWTALSECSAACLTGTQSRTRSVIRVAQFDGKACAHSSEILTCNAGPCPTHCRVSDWSGFDTCTKECGGGRKTRTRTILEDEAWGGRVCPTLQNEQECNVQSCPVPCVLGYWSDFSTCSKECGGGTQSKTRSVVQWNAHGGKACDSLEETQICNRQPCAVDCVQQNWGAWSLCAGECGKEGKTRRTRVTYVPAVADGRPCGDEAEEEVCPMDRCPKFCDVTTWGSWTPCTKQCNYGVQSRARSIQTHDDMSVCPKLTESQQCNTEKCPIDCQFTLWGAWQSYFGGGTTLQRVRQITTQAVGGTPCPTQLKQYKTSTWCTGKDIFGEWGACSAGYQYRHREHQVCSAKASLRYHYVFRQGRHCGVNAVSQAMMLSEEIDLTGKSNTWTTLSVAQVKAYSLPNGHWQKLN